MQSADLLRKWAVVCERHISPRICAKRAGRFSSACAKSASTAATTRAGPAFVQAAGLPPRNRPIKMRSRTRWPPSGICSRPRPKRRARPDRRTRRRRRFPRRLFRTRMMSRHSQPARNRQQQRPRLRPCLKGPNCNRHQFQSRPNLLLRASASWATPDSWQPRW